MSDLKEHLASIDWESVRKALQSPEYKARVEKAMEDVRSLQQRAVVDRARLFIPVDF